MNKKIGFETLLTDLSNKFSGASARYAEMHQIKRDRDWFILKMQEELGELTQIWNKLTGRGRKSRRKT